MRKRNYYLLMGGLLLIIATQVNWRIFRRLELAFSDKYSSEVKIAGVGVLSEESLFDDVVGLPRPFDEEEWRLRVANAINETRRQQGLTPLQIVADLNHSAQNKVLALKKWKAFNHMLPDGTKFFYFMEEEGCCKVWCGENLAVGFKEPEEVIKNWMNSSTHREILLSENFNSMGIGVAKLISYGNNNELNAGIAVVLHADRLDNPYCNK